MTDRANIILDQHISGATTVSTYHADLTELLELIGIVHRFLVKDEPHWKKRRKRGFI